MQELGITTRPVQSPAGLFGQFRSIYDGIAASDNYERNEAKLRLIQLCVITVSAAATGAVNAFAHMEVLGWFGAGLLAILITGFVEQFYFTLRHGLTTIYSTYKQRFAAQLCYRTIQVTMILNASLLCVWIAKGETPWVLSFWNRWSIAVHFTLALLGVSAVRDYDGVVGDRMRQLIAPAAARDLATIRKAAAVGNPVVLIAAHIRGFIDALGVAHEIVRDKPSSRTRKHRANLTP